MTASVNQVEMALLFEAIKTCYGYDFSDYAGASLRRRLLTLLTNHRLKNVAECQHLIIHDEAFFHTFLNDLTITVTEFFRDPHVYQAIEQHVLPYLARHHRFKIWHAGCSTGEEVYSMAILLNDCKVYQQAMMYATDINPKALEFAKSGLFKHAVIEQGIKNYKILHATDTFNAYMLRQQTHVLMHATLRKNIVFTEHNLVTDQSFGEMQLILCRNVMIYFNKNLQNRVLRLLTHSLSIGGYLCLGTGESLKFTSVENCYECVDSPARLYRKIKACAP
tara:strand:- start:27451 stop:28284 length:834 start_codon:yes stop_codon:yes gene_type:complete